MPTPDTAQTTALLAALMAVDPNLAVDDTEAVDDAVSPCSALREGDEPATAVCSAFPGSRLDAGQQQAVVAAVTTTFYVSAGGSAGTTSS